MDPVLTLVLLFTVATGVSVVTRRLRLPYTVALVLAGLALGATKLVDGVHLTKELLYAVFLPGLLFEASYHLPFDALKKNARAIVSLAVPGVVVAVGATASILVATAASVGLGWSHALVFAALIAATDPIAVVALFKSLGAPKRLGVLIEGESLVNDGTSIVLFTIIFTAVTTGGIHPAEAAVEFVRVAGLGCAVGAAVGFGVVQVLKRIADPLVEITITVVAAYGSFVAAEELHFSGVIATVTAGVFCGSYAAPSAMTPTTRIAVESFWEYLAFALNSLVFLLIGLEVSIGQLVDAAAPIGLAFLAVVAGRAIVVFLASGILRRTDEAIPWRWSVMLTWGGLRGALSMVLALALPESFPKRELLVTMTFGVVLLSIVVQGVTAGPLLRALGLAADDPERRKLEGHRTELDAFRAALDEIDRLERDHIADSDAVRELRSTYETRTREAAKLVRGLLEGNTRLRHDETNAAQRRVAEVERAAVQRAYANGLVDAKTRDRLLVGIAARSST